MEADASNPPDSDGAASASSDVGGGALGACHTHGSPKSPNPNLRSLTLSSTTLPCLLRSGVNRGRDVVGVDRVLALAAVAALSRGGSRVLTGQRVDLEHDFVAVVTEESLSGCTAQVRHGQWSYLHSARVGEATHPGPAGSRRT